MTDIVIDHLMITAIRTPHLRDYAYSSKFQAYIRHQEIIRQRKGLPKRKPFYTAYTMESKFIEVK